MKLNFPDYRKLPSELINRFRRQLRRINWLIRACQLVVGVFLPISEAVLTNFATSTPSNSRPFWIGLAVAGVIHLFLLITLLLIEMPLPQFLVEFDEQTTKLEESLAQITTYKSDAATFIESVAATQLSLLEIEQMKSQPREKLEEVIAQVLLPWMIGARPFSHSRMVKHSSISQYMKRGVVSLSFAIGSAMTGWYALTGLGRRETVTLELAAYKVRRSFSTYRRAATSLLHKRRANRVMKTANITTQWSLPRSGAAAKFRESSSLQVVNTANL